MSAATPPGGPLGRVHLGVALAGAGYHPAAWRHVTARPERLFDADHLVDLVRTAERGTLDLVIADDTFAPQPPDAHRLWGRLDALLAMARVAPHTRSIGLVATIDVTHTEPFHVSKNVATLDLVSRGRAGWRVGLSTTGTAARLFGRKPAAPLDELVAEADEVVDVAARLWDSWEDDAVIRDRTTGRYVDRDKLHYVDFEGRFFKVRGPSITPRPPQGQPVVVVDATSGPADVLAATRADVALIAAPDAAVAAARRDDLRRRAAAAGRSPDQLTVLVVADVLLGPDADTVAADRRHLDALAGGAGNGNGNGAEAPVDGFAGTLDVAGTPADLAALVEDWFRSGATDGFVLRPALLPDGLDQIVDEVVPRLRAAGVFRPGYAETTLRARLGLGRPPNRYAGTDAASDPATDAATDQPEPVTGAGA